MPAFHNFHSKQLLPLPIEHALICVNPREDTIQSRRCLARVRQLHLRVRRDAGAIRHPVRQSGRHLSLSSNSRCPANASCI